MNVTNKIFETIYYGSCVESNNLAKLYGKYETFDESPASKGILQFDFWNNVDYSLSYDWNNL